ncbi:trafficking protein particle complex subunit 12 [Trichonephila clavata]|uniref:Trafficking protein particle complex subunit 12 n=1 Tax=Trichonephila clavata TaxID=2740835 RepID=A0A8X6LVX5_TRICU|nr:trafficking protein particle complex subunit 12 [Trichonephila clavata]
METFQEKDKTLLTRKQHFRYLSIWYEENTVKIKMEAENEVPQLPVETENVRRNSSSISDIQIAYSPTENKATNLIKPVPEISLDVKDEPNIKRVDSDSKFGFMETVPLELSMQESAPNSPAPNLTVENSETVSVQMRSFSLTDKQSSGIETSFKTRPQSADANVLSKYFGAEPSQLEKADAEGLNFFNALAESTVKDSQNVSASSIMTNKSEELKNTELAEEVVEDSVPGKDVNNPAPILLKFFSEDKSGNDRDGKAFFDKIAEEKTPVNPSVLEIKNPIINLPAGEQFLNSPVLSNEIEEAWIPSEKTRQTLVSVITSNAPLSLDKSQLTTPGVIVEKDMEDPVKELLLQCNSIHVQHRKTLTDKDVTEDEAGLQKLMEAGCYNAAINLTKRLLKACGQGLGDDGKPSKHTPLSLRLWYVRLALFVKLHHFSYAEVEGAAFGDLDKPDLYYEFYPDVYKGKRGTMVPFPLRLLLAELPQYQGNSQIALDNLYQILNVIQKVLKNVQNGCAEDGSMIKLSDSRRAASLEIWGKRERRVLYSILNCILSQKDYILAVSVVNILIEKSTEDTPQLYSALGRIYLQLGDVKYAHECFTKAVALSKQFSQDFLAEENINKALMAIAHNNNEEAYKFYEKAFSICPNNAMLANNMAVCLLYMGRLKESLELLEKTIHNNPLSCLHDGLLFNICTLYELESSRCAQKKQAMLELVSKHVGDSFNVSCLKIPIIPKQ